MDRGARVADPRRYAAVVVGAFLVGLALAVYRGRIPGYPAFYSSLPPWMRAFDQGVIWLLVALATVRAARGVTPGRALARFGLVRSPVRPVLFALLCTAPMLVTYAAIGRLDREGLPLTVVAAVVAAPLAEELFFRGFAFGELVRAGRWGFWPAAIVTGAVFGAVHLSGAVGREPLAGALGVVAITALGGGWFAWLYMKWDENLWVPIFMHALMNLWWMAFEIDDTALGGWSANGARGVTIALSIVLTLTRPRWPAWALGGSGRDHLRERRDQPGRP